MKAFRLPNLGEGLREQKGRVQEQQKDSGRQQQDETGIDDGVEEPGRGRATAGG